VSAAVCALAVLGALLVPGAPRAAAALPGSVPFEVVEYYDNDIFLLAAPGTYIRTCRYFVLAVFDEDEAFYQDTAEGPKPFVLAQRGSGSVLTQRAYASIPGFTYQFGQNITALPQEGRLPDITAPPGKLFYISYGLQLNNDQQNDFAPAESRCYQLASFQASGQAPANARNLLGLFPKPSPVDVTLSSVERNVELGEQVPVTMELRNTSDRTVDSVELLGGTGLQFNADYLELVSGPQPPPGTTLQPGETVTFAYTLQALRTGTIEIRGGFDGTLDGESVSGDDTLRLTVPPDIDVVLTSSVTTATKVGDEFQVVATLTNNDPEDVGDVRAEPLAQDPGGLVTPVTGPLDSAGRDVRTFPLTLPAGGTETITWTYRAEERGSVELTAQLSGRDPREDSLFFLSESITVGIEAPGLTITDLRLQPGSIVPGDFGNLRGTITNNGSVDVTGIDFDLTSTPELLVVDGLLDRLDPAVSPRIPKLAAEESRDFVIPVAMVTDAGDLATYRTDLTMRGTAQIGGVPTEVSTGANTGNALDLTVYWSTIFDSVLANLFTDTLEVVEGINTWGDSSTLGGMAVGSTEGALAAFRKLGDGAFAVTDLVLGTVEDGGARLTLQGEALAAAAREYLHTTSAKKMAVDLANLEEAVAVGGVGIMADWLRDIDRAYVDGDAREVARLLAEPSTAVAIGLGVERAGGQLFTQLASRPIVRETMDVLLRAPEPIPDGPDVPYNQIVRRELQDLREMPTGVAITGETVARAGIDSIEHGWMIDMAREHGVAFFVRPRPETATRFAAMGYNAKPMAIKLKSVTERDAKWLGWEDFADSEGLVVFRKPKDPLPAMMDAVDRGELEWGGAEIDKIIERYNLRLAEWKSFEQPFGPDGPTVDPREGILMKLNGDSLGPDGTIQAGDGFTIKRFGKTVRTKITIDPDGVLRFSHNDKPVYSDIDLLHIAKPDGSPIDPEVHRLISQQAGAGFDAQHGDSVATSDFPNWDTAKKFAVQYANEHKRGGDPLVIVGADATTLGYVQDIDVPEGPIGGSDYDLYAKITTTYEGAGRR
jgi:hypothetical protein